MQISIFPSISENLNEVLDSMYHREVTEGESIITQGADGDNFYVIERFVQHGLVEAYDARFIAISVFKILKFMIRSYLMTVLYHMTSD